MKMGAWEEAERSLLAALAVDAKHADSLANLAVAQLHLGKPPGRHQGQLRTLAPGHPLVARGAALDEAFTRAASSAASA